MACALLLCSLKRRSVPHAFLFLVPNLEKYSNIEAFAKKHGIDFYPAGRGIGHQVLCEEGYVFPNRMVVASDSHSNM